MASVMTLGQRAIALNQAGNEVAAEENVDKALLALAAAVRARTDSINPSDIETIRDSEQYSHMGLTPRSINNSGTYQTGSNLVVSLARDGEQFTFPSNLSQRDVMIVVTHFGIMVNYDLNILNLDDVRTDAWLSFRGPGSYQAFNRPMYDFMMTPFVQANGVAFTGTAAQAISTQGWFSPSRPNGIIAYELPRPMLIKENEGATATINGLAGSLPSNTTFTISPVTYGYLFNRN